MAEPIETVLSALERAGSRGQMTKPGERWQYQTGGIGDARQSERRSIQTVPGMSLGKKE